MKAYYITTPLYYVNDVPHIGHAYTTVAADVLARWKRLCGEQVFFLTGTDEHGSKIAEAAGAQVTPKVYADRVAGEFKRLWDRLCISNDDFIRTTEERHERVAAHAFLELFKKGDIELGTYEDWYCVPCETFVTEGEVKGGSCPNCGRPVERLKEESYFFRLSRYERPLLDHYQRSPDFLSPSFRAREIVNFVKSGLKDLSVSRPVSRVPWGIPVPAAQGLREGHTIYVWFEALLNYITAPGYLPPHLTPPPRRGEENMESSRQGKIKSPLPTVGEGPSSSEAKDRGEGDRNFNDIWPADVHLVGKEIFRFHTVIWPAMLMALGLELPRKVFAHGWWTVEGKKMSKSLGNVVDPHLVCDEYGVDAFRYFLLREVPFGSDGDFSQQALLNRYNADLANALGNLLSRTLTLVEKHFHGQLPSQAFGRLSLLKDLKSQIAALNSSYDALGFHDALDTIWSFVWVANKYIDEQAPWKIGPAEKDRLATILGECYGVLCVLAVFLWPYMPERCLEMWRQLGGRGKLPETGLQLIKQGYLDFGTFGPIAKADPLFPRKGRW